jgi:hypothetical protein
MTRCGATGKRRKVAEWRPRKWRKLHYDFATSKKLRNVGSDALALLATMIATAWWDDESNEGRMYDAEDVPTQRADLYIGAQLTFARGEKAFKALEQRKVVAIVDGLVTLPRFREHQRGDSGERMKRHRARHSDGDVTPPVTSRVTDSRMQNAEAEAENPTGSPVAPKGATKKTAPVEPGPALVAPSLDSGRPTASTGLTLPANDLPGEESPGLLSACSPAAQKPRKGGRRKPRSTIDDALLRAAYDAFAEARRVLTGVGPDAFDELKPERVASLRDRLEYLAASSSGTVESWAAVVRVRLAMDQRREGFGSLTWPSLTTPDNFERWLLEAQKRPSGGRPPSGPAPVSARPTATVRREPPSVLRIAKETP